MKVDNKGDVADDDKDFEEVVALKKCYTFFFFSQCKVNYTIVVISVVVVVEVVDIAVVYFIVVTFSIKFYSGYLSLPLLK